MWSIHGPGAEKPSSLASSPTTLKSPPITTVSPSAARARTAASARPTSAAAMRRSPAQLDACRFATSNPPSRRTIWQTRRSFAQASRKTDRGQPAPLLFRNAGVETTVSCGRNEVGSRRTAPPRPANAERRAWRAGQRSPIPAVIGNGLNTALRDGSDRGHPGHFRAAGAPMQGSPEAGRPACRHREPASSRHAAWPGGQVLPWKRFQLRISTGTPLPTSAWAVLRPDPASAGFFQETT